MRTLCKQASVCSVVLLNRHVLHHTVCVSLCIYMYAHTQTHTKHAPIASLGGGGGGGVTLQTPKYRMNSLLVTHQRRW